MLVQSPIIQTSPANTSPLNPFHVYHYAPSPSPRQSPSSSSRISASLRRIQSSPALAANSPASVVTSAKASPSFCPPPPKRYVAVDASTQYSPMDPPTGPVASAASAAQATQPDVSMEISTPTTTARQANLSTTEEVAQTSTALQPAPANAPENALSVAQATVQTASPNKRRNSHSQHEDGSASGPDASGRVTSPAKRARPEATPAKVLPQRYELCQVEDIVILVTNLLCELIEANDKLALRAGHLTRFHSRTAPGISVLDYLHRLAKHATLSPPLLLSMVYYIDKLFSAYPDFTINTLTVHRFLITAAAVAAKGLSDSFWNNTTYARIGGLRVAELNVLELEFLQRVDWKIVPKPEDLVAYYRGLVDRCDTYELEEEAVPEVGDEALSDDEDDEISDEIDVDDDEDDVMSVTDATSNATAGAQVIPADEANKSMPTGV